MHLFLCVVNCDVLIKQSLADDSKIGEAIKSFMDKRMDGMKQT